MLPEEAARHLLEYVDTGKFARNYVDAFLETVSINLASTVH